MEFLRELGEPALQKVLLCLIYAHGHALLRARGGGDVVRLSAAALLAFLTVAGTKPAGSAVIPALCGVIGASALIWLLTEWLRRRTGRTHLGLHVGGVIISEADCDALLQITVQVRNPGTESVPVYGWRTVLMIAGRAHDLRHVYGHDRVHGSVDLPFLDRLGPLAPGQAAGLLQFSVPGMRQAPVVEALDAPDPLVLQLELDGRGRRKWRTAVDLRELAAEKRTERPANENATEGVAWDAEQERRELLRVAQKTETELETCRRRLSKAMTKRRGWHRERQLPAEIYNTQWTASPNAADEVAINEALRDFYVWTDEMNGKMARRGAAEYSAVGTVQVDLPTLDLDDDVISELDEGFRRVASAQEALAGLIERLRSP
jgi:hypothetical protein